MRGSPRIPADSPPGSAGRSREMTLQQRLERVEVALRQVLEPPPSGGDGGVGGIEALDGAEQVLVVFAQLQLHRAGEGRIGGELGGGAPGVAARVDQRAEAE